MPEFSLVRSGEGLEALASEWQDLEQRMPVRAIYQTFAWHWRAWTCMAEPRGRRPLVIVGRQNGRAVLIWPLAVASAGPIRVAQPLSSETTEYSEVLLDPAVATTPALDAAWAHFIGHAGVDLLDVWFVRDGSNLARVLEGRPGLTRLSQPSPYLDLTRFESWEAYHASLSKKLRPDLRRRRRRLEEQGEVRFRIAETEAEAGRGLDWLLVHKAERYREQNIDADWFETDAYRAFMHGVVQDALASGRLYLATLELDGRIVAAKLGFHINGWQDSLIDTYDPELHSCSPGKLLIEETLKWAFVQGHEVFDYRIGDEGYKYDWMKDEVEGHRCQMPTSLLGRLYLVGRDNAVRRRLLWWSTALARRLPKGGAS